MSIPDLLYEKIYYMKKRLFVLFVLRYKFSDKM